MSIKGKLCAQDWQDLASAYAFIGNSLLKPMTQTNAAGLNPEFWDAFPNFDNAEVIRALNACKAYANIASKKEESQAILDVSVEYTRLFIGPPSPVAAPWETMYRTCAENGAGAAGGVGAADATGAVGCAAAGAGGVGCAAAGAGGVGVGAAAGAGGASPAGSASVGFGEATFQMRQLLRERGLELSNENHQYEDHLGIELLYLCELCRAREYEKAKEFAATHPLSWIDAFSAKVQEAFPQGYFSALLELTRALLLLLFNPNMK